GTAWTSQTLLARQARLAREEEAQDGIQRLFFYTADDVAALVPDYAAHLERVIKERGRQHPLVRTQYFNEEIDAQGGMFHAGRLALMFRGDAAAAGIAAPGSGIHAFCIDVGGMDEANAGLTESSLMKQTMEMGNPGRDSTTLSVIEIDLSTLETLQAPTYRVVHREAWTGLNHVTVFGRLKALAETWNPQHIVIDATGVGEGLWAMLDKAYPSRVIPVKFTQQEKSEIGWRFLSIIETGRFRAFSPALAGSPLRSDRQRLALPPAPSPLRSEVLRDPHLLENEDGEGCVRLQYASCRSEILPGPSKTLRWGVPDGVRGPDGQLIHDDFIMADALVAKLDELQWSIHLPAFIIRARDPLDEMSHTRPRSSTEY
ncbi:MAG TPA: hypothetical protein VMJ64_13140, partial [Anaerolineales bacterium]|nr:hypothetical protein [Anaerolineales bacterium]